MSPHGSLPSPTGPLPFPNGASERRPRRTVRSPLFGRSVSVILPAYNEQECIEDAVRDCLDFLPRCFAKYEVVVVNDGSKDATGDIIRELELEFPGIVTGVQFEKNRGYGAAIMAGFRAGRGELLFYTDSDRQFDICELEAAVELLEEKKIEALFGYRVYRYDSVLRCITSWIYNRLVRVLFAVKVRDVDCAFKLFERHVLDRMHVACTDFFIDTELVARTAKQGHRTIEMGVRHFPRTAGRTTVHPGHIPKTLLTVGRMWLMIHFGIGAQKALARDAARTDVVVVPQRRRSDAPAPEPTTPRGAAVEPEHR